MISFCISIFSLLNIKIISSWNNCLWFYYLQVKITGKWKSEFVIRTQPDNDSVSTLEAIAIALSQFENNPEIIKVFAYCLLHSIYTKHQCQQRCRLTISDQCTFSVPSEDIWNHLVRWSKILDRATLQRLINCLEDPHSIFFRHWKMTWKKY